MIERIFSELRTFLDPPGDIKSNPAERYNIPPSHSGRGLPHVSDPDTTTQAVKIEAWIYISLNVIGKSLSAAPLIVETQETQDGELAWVTHDTGPLHELLQRPNPRESMDILEWRLIMSLLCGDAYLIRSEDANEMYHCRPKLVKPIVVPEEGITGYEIGDVFHKQTVDVDRVVHFALPNPLNEFYGLSPMEAIKKPVLIDHYYFEWLYRFFKNGAVPGGILSSEQAVSDESAEKAKQEWERKFGGGPGQSHRLAVVDEGLTYQTVTPPLKELIVELMYKMPREIIIAAFGVPPVLNGLFEYANYANSKEQIRIFWESTIKPMQRVLATTFNMQLVPTYEEIENKKLRVRYDNSEITALQEDENERVERLVKATGGQPIFTPNEARKKAGMDPVDQDGADELHFRTTPSITFGSDGGDKDGKSETPVPLAVRVADSGPRLIKWEAHHKKVMSIEKSFAAIIRRHFDRQLDRILSRLDQISIGNNVSAALLYSKILAMKDDADDEAERLMNLIEEAAALRQATDGFMRETVHRAGQEAIEEAAVDLFFDINNPEVTTMIEQFHNRSKLINNTTYDKVKDILREAYDEGWGIPEIEKRLRGFYKDHAKVSATRTAQTEMNGMVNGGARQGYTDAGVEKIMWQSAMLSTSRTTHVEADGQVIPITGKFYVGGEYLKAPSDPSGRADNTINCHCGIGPAVEE